MRPEPGSVQKTASGTAAKKSWPNLLIITLTLAVAGATLVHPVGTPGDLDALLLLAAAGSISALAVRLPLQSVLFAAGITALIGGAAHGLSARTGIPLGPLLFGETMGPKLFGTVPWTVCLLWIIAVFNSRGVARLILRPWRKMRNYGFLLIGLTTVLVVAFDLGLEPFAKINRFWFWQPTKIHVTWHGASPVSFCGWAFVTLIIMAFVTPFLIRKQPGDLRGPEFSPLVLWLGGLVLFAVNAALAGQWTVVVVDGIILLSAGFFSWRGARW